MGDVDVKVVLNNKSDVEANEQIFINNMFDKLSDYLSDIVHVCVKREDKYKIDAYVNVNKDSIIRAEAIENTLEEAVVNCMYKLRDKIDDYSTVEFKRCTTEYQHEHRVCRHKTIYPVVMSIEEAIEEMNNSEHDFYGFINKLESGKEVPAIVYRRKSGGFGYINMAC